MFLSIEKVKRETLAVVQDDGTKMTYGDLIDFSELVMQTIPERTFVFLMCENTIGALAGYVAFLSGHIVPLLLSAEMDEELLSYLLDTYVPNFLWLPERMSKQFGGECVLKNYGYALIAYSSQNVELNSSLALLLTTSGSTGSPKLVRQSYNNIDANAKSIAEYLELDKTERAITMLPMNYTYGLSVIQSHLLVGATILMTKVSYAQRAFWEFFTREGATSIVGVPYTYEMLKRLRFFHMQLPSLRYMTQAGGKLLPELHREFAEFAKEKNIRFYVMYGQTEATARMSYLPYQCSLEKYGSMGIAIPGGRFYLRDPDGAVIKEAHKTGELIYEGANVTLGYAETQMDLAKGDERHGTLETGDMAEYDEDGYFYIVGRKKRFLKIYGNRVNLDECERLIQEHFENVECACVGNDDHLQVYISGVVEEKEVGSFLLMKTGLNSHAFEVYLIDKIPKNDAGKKQYHLLNK